MSRRFFTADWHCFMTDIIRFENRPFENICQMNDAYVKSCNDIATDEDTIIHIGDLFSYKSDRGNDGSMMKPNQFISQINATFLNIKGNHDINNKVKSICTSMQTNLGRQFPNVIIGHYPSYDRRAEEYVRDGYICLCGHVHRKWKHCLDLDHQCLNINVGVDAWQHKIVSEDDLIKYIIKVLQYPKEKLNTFKSKTNYETI